MKASVAAVFGVLALLVCVQAAEGEILTFNDPSNLGIFFDPNDPAAFENDGILWVHSTVSPHFGYLICRNSLFDGSIYFAAPTMVNSWQMNGFPKPDAEIWNTDTGYIDVAAYDANANELWQATIDLTSYTNNNQDWSRWIAVDCNVGNVTQMTFFKRDGRNDGNSFWPSIDNMVINQVVPEPGTLTLFSMGIIALALAWRRRKR